MKSIKTNKTNWSVLIGAAFLMATSSVGPGFMTQTASFTAKYGADFAFAIVISVIFTFIAQINVWSIIAVSEMRGQDIANKLLPGLGYFIAFLVALGGLAFNIGNIGGTSIGLNILFGTNTSIGAGIGGTIGILIFMSRKAGKALDLVTKVLGTIMLCLIGYVAFITNPPVLEAVSNVFMPTNIHLFATITLVGGTVGGYITFSGGHRLIDAGITGVENLPLVQRAAKMGMAVDATVRILLFLAVLGVVTLGFNLNPKDPAGSAFLHAAGTFGYKIFGVVFFCASMTSVVGAAYTSVSFLKTLSKTINKYENISIMIFIFVSTCILIFMGHPAKLLILAGSLNGLILPVTLTVMLIATTKKHIVGDYKYSKVLFYLGWLVVIITSYIGVLSLNGIMKLF